MRTVLTSIATSVVVSIVTVSFMNSGLPGNSPASPGSSGVGAEATPGGPRYNDVYENLETGERIRIRAVGKCGELYESALLDHYGGRGDASSQAEDSILSGLFPKPVDFFTNPNKHCIQFHDNESAIIVTSDYLNRAWQRLN